MRIVSENRILFNETAMLNRGKLCIFKMVVRNKNDLIYVN